MDRNSRTRFFIRFRAILAVATIGILLMPLLLRAATITWTAGAAGNWSTGANWSGGVAPSSTDTAFFSASSTKNVTIDTPITVASFQVSSTYTGTIIQGASTMVVGTSSYTQAAGTFNGGGANFTDNGSFSLTGGTFSLSATTSAATFTVSSTAQVSGSGVFIDRSSVSSTIMLGSSFTNNGKVILDGAGTTCSAPFPNYVILQSTVGGTQRSWVGPGQYTMNYLDVKDQAGTSTIFVLNGTSRSNNGTNWTFGGGALSNWSSTTAFPTQIRYQGSFAYNNYLYSIGGNNGGFTTKVYFAPINATGSLGNWTSTASLPSGIMQTGTGFYNGYVYVVGGATNWSVGTSTVYYAKVNATGSISNWSSTTPLPASTMYNTFNGTFINNGYLYSVAEIANGGGSTSTVYDAQINGDGSVGNWTSTTKWIGSLSSGDGESSINNNNLHG
jgi:hypothetical protein